MDDTVERGDVVEHVWLSAVATWSCVCGTSCAVRRGGRWWQMASANRSQQVNHYHRRREVPVRMASWRTTGTSAVATGAGVHGGGCGLVAGRVARVSSQPAATEHSGARLRIFDRSQNSLDFTVGSSISGSENLVPSQQELPVSIHELLVPLAPTGL